MTPREKSNEVVAAFQRVVKGKGRHEADAVSVEDLEAALQDYVLDKDSPWYRAMADGLARRRRDSDRVEATRMRRKEWFVTFLLGAIAGVISTVIATLILRRLGAL